MGGTEQKYVGEAFETNFRSVPSSTNSSIGSKNFSVPTTSSPSAQERRQCTWLS